MSTSGSSRPADIYTHGHHSSVLRSHSARTAQNSAGYLVPHLHAGDRVLDVGCGPGSITLDFAELVAPGKVIGLEQSQTAVAAAREAAAAAESKASFVVGDVYALEFADSSFDVVHAHQVLQHLSDPSAALREMSRVCRPGGIVAVRDADYSAMSWYPASVGLSEWMDLYQRVARANAAEPDGGRHLLAWAHAAGLHDITPSASVWCYATAEDRTEWGQTWAVRVTQSEFARQALAAGFAIQADLDRLAAAWRDWAADPDGWFTISHGELICTVPSA
ncbi:MAG: methyltransferase domain-containing protein [Actinomycetota bacterium]|nr:methyltransferase domain-containing protein [Actinomycetota bacterium]